MDYEFLKRAKFQGGFEGRFLQLMAKEAAFQEMAKEAGFGDFLRAGVKGVGTMMGHAQGAAPALARVGEELSGTIGRQVGRAQGFRRQLANSFNAGRDLGYESLAGAPRPKPVTTMGAAPAGAAPPVMHAPPAGPGAVPPVINHAAPAPGVAPQAYGGVGPSYSGTAAGSFGMEPPNMAQPGMEIHAPNVGEETPLPTSQTSPWADNVRSWARERPLTALGTAAGAGLVGQNMYDSHVNAVRRREMESRIGNMGFGDRLGAAFQLMMNPQQFGYNAAQQTFQPTFFSRL